MMGYGRVLEAAIQTKPGRFILIFCLFAGSFAHSAFPQSIVFDNAEDQQQGWNNPVKVIQDSSWHFPVFNTALTKNNQGLFVFSNTIPNPGVADIEEYYNNLYDIKEPLVAVGPGGRRISVPDGEYSFAYPRATADTSGVIHLLWAEHDPEISEDQWPVYTQIYHSRYNNGDWSAPQMIYQAISIRWEPESTSTFFLDHNNQLHFMFEVNKTEKTGKGSCICIWTGKAGMKSTGFTQGQHVHTWIWQSPPPAVC